MKLWLISQTENCDYDTYDSAVVAAKDELSARNTHPGEEEDWARPYRTWASSPDKVKAELIGDAAEGTPAGVILASFNAG